MKELTMEHQLPAIYVIDQAGIEQKLEVVKLRVEFQNGAKVTIEVSDHNPQNTAEIVLRGYYGDKEYERSDRIVSLNIRPGACNLINVKPELYLSKT